MQDTTVDELISRASELYRRRSHNEDARLTILRCLQCHSGAREVVTACGNLSSSRRHERLLACDILAALADGNARAQVALENVETILARLAKDADQSVRCAALIALGRWGLPSTEQIVIYGATSASTREQEAATRALASFHSSRSTSTLLSLLATGEPTVRQWAILSLDSRDSSEIKEGLLRAATDGDPETKEEAFLALAERKDPRVVSLLRRYLEEADEVGELAIQAAREAGSPDLSSALMRLREWWDLDSELIDEAISRCAPTGTIAPLDDPERRS